MSAKCHCQSRLDINTLVLVSSRASVLTLSAGMMTELKMAKSALLDGLLNSPPSKPFLKRRCISDVSTSHFLDVKRLFLLVIVSWRILSLNRNIYGMQLH